MIYLINIYIINIINNIWIEGGDFNRGWDWISILEVVFEGFDWYIKDFRFYFIYKVFY